MPLGLFARSKVLVGMMQYVQIRLFSAIPMPSDVFYEELGKIHRVYFYRMDTRGLLYLEQTLQQITDKHARKFQGNGESTGDLEGVAFSGRTISNALKDDKFLRFFGTMLRPTENCAQVTAGVPSGTVAGVDVHTYCSTYPYVSLCGHELNFLRHDDPLAALGFTELQPTANGGNSSDNGDGGSGSASGMELLYQGGSEPFLPGELLVSATTQRVYHPITRHRRLKKVSLGLLHPHLAGTLAANARVHSDGRLLYKWRGAEWEIRTVRERPSKAR